MTELVRQRRENVLTMLDTIVRHLRTFADGFQPKVDDEIPSLLLDDSGSEYWRVARQILDRHLARWPREVLSACMGCSVLIADAAARGSELEPGLSAELLKRRPPGLSAVEAGHYRSRSPRGAELDAIARAKRRFLERHTGRYVPYENLIYTFFGPAALDYLALASREGLAKIQPHEVSREEWRNLDRIDAQVRLDLELSALAASDGEAAKDAVAAAWGAAAVLAHLSPSVFLAETGPYVSSAREAGLTVSYGRDARVLLAPVPRSVVDAADFVRNAIADDVLDAVDLMWMAHALVEVDHVAVPHGREEPAQSERHRVFLSHRGVDAKAALVGRIIDHDAADRPFLDCLNISAGCVNRLFVYRSLARSREVCLIRTERFDGSSWCLREQAFARRLDALGRLRCREFASVEAAWRFVSESAARPGEPAALEPQSIPAGDGPYTRIEADHVLGERAVHGDSLSAHGTFLEQLDRCRARVAAARRERGGMAFEAGGAAEVAAAGRDLHRAALATAVRAAGDPDPERLAGVDLVPREVLVVFAQALFGWASTGTETSNKLEARGAADDVGELASAFVDLAARAHGAHAEPWLGYVSAMAIGLALQFDRRRTNPLPARVGRELCTGAGVVRGRHILFDVRAGGAVADFKLGLAALLIRSGVGSIAIVQDASAPVHEASVDGFELSVLPCVTVYPGTADLLGVGPA